MKSHLVTIQHTLTLHTAHYAYKFKLIKTKLLLITIKFNITENEIEIDYSGVDVLWLVWFVLILFALFRLFNVRAVFGLNIQIQLTHYATENITTFAGSIK